jgi:hypothetical protein
MSNQLYQLFANVNKPSLWSTVLEELIVAHLFKNYPPFMIPEGTLSLSQGPPPPTDPYPQPDEFSLHPQHLLLQDKFAVGVLNKSNKYLQLKINLICILIVTFLD